MVGSGCFTFPIHQTAIIPSRSRSRRRRELEVNVVDPKTKKVASRTFTITDKTKLLRDGKPVTVANAAVQKGEQVAVVVDHDKPGDEAIEVRLTTKK